MDNMDVPTDGYTLHIPTVQHVSMCVVCVCHSRGAPDPPLALSLLWRRAR